MEGTKQTGISRNVGGAILAVAAVASISVLAFAPGVGCGATSAADAAKQARERALGRHRFEAISNYLETQRKNARRAAEKRRRAAEDPNAKAVNSRAQATFRAGVVIGAWQRFIANPYKQNGGRFDERQAAIALRAVRGIDSKLNELASSAKAANLEGVELAARNMDDALPALGGSLKDRMIGANDFARADTLLGELQAQAREAKLPVLPKANTSFLPR